MIYGFAARDNAKRDLKLSVLICFDVHMCLCMHSMLCHDDCMAQSAKIRIWWIQHFFLYVFSISCCISYATLNSSVCTHISYNLFSILRVLCSSSKLIFPAWSVNSVFAYLPALCQSILQTNSTKVTGPSILRNCYPLVVLLPRKLQRVPKRHVW